VLRKVLVDLDEIIELRIGLSHKKIDIQVVLAAQILYQLLAWVFLEIVQEVFQFLQARLMVLLAEFPMLPSTGILADAGVASHHTAKWLNFGIFWGVRVFGEGNEFIVTLAPTLVANFDVVLVFEENKPHLPNIVVILEVDVLPYSWPILWYHYILCFLYLNYIYHTRRPANLQSLSI
jgi:hypothetical protein